MRSSFARWRPLGTKDWLLKLTTGGQGYFGHAQGRLTVRRWDIVLIEPGIPHDYGLAPTVRRWDFVWAHFIPRPEWIPLLQWPAEHGIRRLSLDAPGLAPRVLRRFREVHQRTRSTLHHREWFAMNGLEEVLLWCSTANPATPQVTTDPRIRRAMEHMAEHLAAPLSIGSLAAVSGLSPSRFAHLFKQELGCSPHEFLTVQRLGRARQLLARGPSPIAEIAAEVGFRCPFYFSLRFKAKTGMSPSQYREKADHYDPLANETSENRRDNMPPDTPRRPGGA
jgi:AraC family transcriptional regulator of arabinose operon